MSSEDKTEDNPCKKRKTTEGAEPGPPSTVLAPVSLPVAEVENHQRPTTVPTPPPARLPIAGPGPSTSRPRAPPPLPGRPPTAGPPRAIRKAKRLKKSKAGRSAKKKSSGRPAKGPPSPPPVHPSGRSTRAYPNLVPLPPPPPIRKTKPNTRTPKVRLSLNAAEMNALKQISYWDSVDAQSLFYPGEGETVKQAMERRIELLGSVISDQTKWRELLLPDGDFERLTATHQQKIVTLSILIRKTYMLFLENRDKTGISFLAAMERSIEMAKDLGIKCPSLTNVKHTHHAFIREGDKFKHPVKKKESHVPQPIFFKLYPEAKRMFRDFLNDYVTGQDENDGAQILENIVGAEITHYLMDEIVPVFHQRHNKGLEEKGEATVSPTDFLAQCRIKGSKGSGNTVYRWLTQLGYRIKRDYVKSAKSYFEAKRRQEEQENEDEGNDYTYQY